MIDAQKEKELKAQYGKVLVVEIDGKVLVFKKFTKGQVQDLIKNVSKKPDMALELSINACGFACVLGQENLASIAEEYPLAFAGGEDHPGICEQLVSMSRGAAVFRQV